MRRKIVGGIAVLAIAGFCVGCGTTNAELARHNKGRVIAVQKSMRSVTRFIDRHLFNFTWDDPYAYASYSDR